MIRRPYALLLALGLIAPLALVDSPAGALDQDLVASVTTGPPGTVVTLSSASCVASGDLEAYLDVTLYSGTGVGEKLAGFGSGSEGSATVTIPDWIDPDQPMSIEAECYQYDPETGGGDDITYDPIAFDPEPGVATPVQVPTFSRTELLSGQSTLVSGAGCAAQALVQVVALEGTDLSGRTSSEDSGFAYGSAEGGSFETELAMSNGSIVFDIGGPDDDPTVDVSEEPNTMSPGPYSVFAYCIGANDSAIVLEPSLIELTGSIDTSQIDLTVPEGTADATLAGTCVEGDVDGSLGGQTLADFGLLRAGSPAPSAVRGPDALVQAAASATARVTSADGLGTGSNRSIEPHTEIEFSAAPDGAGAWTFGDTASFDDGWVYGFATCGDPLADGYFYDPQIAEVAVAEAETTTTTTTTAPPSVPAAAVAGTPTYAG